MRANSTVDLASTGINPQVGIMKSTTLRRERDNDKLSIVSRDDTECGVLEQVGLQCNRGT